jgi:hypothetical protein
MNRGRPAVAKPAGAWYRSALVLSSVFDKRDETQPLAVFVNSLPDFYTPLGTLPGCTVRRGTDQPRNRSV